MKMNKSIPTFVAGLSCLTILLWQASALAQSSDTVDRLGGGRPVRGKIVEISPTAIVIQSGGNNQTVKASEVDRTTFADASGPVKQAITQFQTNRLNDCLDTIEKIKPADLPKNRFVIAELAYCKAMAKSVEALRGADITLSDARTEMNSFLTKFPKSYHYYPASKTFAELAMATGSAQAIAAAKSKYKELLSSNWPELILLGHLELGKIALIENKPDQALAQFKKIAEDSKASSQQADELKLVAKCRAAQAKAMQGDTATAIKEIQAIIKKESSDNKLLFANAYNALGHCHLKAGSKKEALLAFLHTQMLYSSLADTHAEALYHLFSLWNDLSYPDRARETQQMLRSSLRNTYYAYLEKNQ